MMQAWKENAAFLSSVVNGMKVDSRRLNKTFPQCKSCSNACDRSQPQKPVDRLKQPQMPAGRRGQVQMNDADTRQQRTPADRQICLCKCKNRETRTTGNKCAPIPNCQKRVCSVSLVWNGCPVCTCLLQSGGWRVVGRVRSRHEHGRNRDIIRNRHTVESSWKEAVPSNKMPKDYYPGLREKYTIKSFQ